MSDLRAKIFTHGGSQAVRLPKAFRFDASEVRIRKEGQRVILEPIQTDWAAVWRDIDDITDAPFPDRAEQLIPREIDFDE
ncbi:antitoxin [Phenylobacterium sp.]|jgi:antitoxin VapB|uniref:antitoxin n=1 Tax=Phenylobacterium sp. TaxID=1871053 RepID=UPI00300392A2